MKIKENDGDMFIKKSCDKVKAKKYDNFKGTNRL